MKSTPMVIAVLVLTIMQFSVLNGEPFNAEFEEDWIISDEKAYKDKIIELNSNLVIKNGGILNFNNITLIINCTSDGQYGIKIENGGKFELSNSIIKSKTKYKFYLNIENNGELKAVNSTMENFDTRNPTDTTKDMTIIGTQAILFGLVVGMVILAIVYWKFGKPTSPTTSGKHSLVGKEGIVVEKIFPDNFKGKIRVESSVWSATSKKEVEKGKKAVVESAEGVHLVVKEKGS